MNWDEKAKDYAGGKWRPDGGAVSAVANLAIQEGASWQREAMLSDETVERAARGIHASHDRGWHFEAEDHAVQDEYRDMARAALTAAIGGDDE